jgi:hypothetical protein
MNPKQVLTFVLSTAALVCVTQYAQAQFLYNNSTTYLDKGYGPGSGVEFGDEIVLDTGIQPAAQLSDMSFEYFNTGGSGNETVRIRFYSNDGTDGAPGTMLFDSGVSGALPTGRHLATISGLTTTVPKRFIWTATFSGVEGGEDVGLSLYSPPTVPASGGNFVDYWEKVSGTWTLKTISGVTSADFGASFLGTAVPEPSAIVWTCLYGIGGVGVALFRRLRRK